MRRPQVLLLATALLAAACDRPGPRASEEYAAAAQALADLIHFPGATLISTSAGDEAAEARYTARATTDSVAAYYRGMLAERGYVVERETEDDGVHTIYSRRADQPIWVRIHANAGGPGVSWSVVGVYARASDSTAADTSRI